MATGKGSPIKAILYAFFANLGIAITKTIAAILTGSSSMFTESLHFYADTCNQLLLIVIAVFLSIRIKSLLIGPYADPELRAAMKNQIVDDKDIDELFNVITMQMGSQVMLASKIKMRDIFSVNDACIKINALEKHLKEEFPEIGWCFIEPDVCS